MLSNLLADLRYSSRGLARRPLFASVLVLTLAVGIGEARVARKSRHCLAAE